MDDVQVQISSDLDLVRAREQGRVLAGQLGFIQSDLTLVATAISELARNIVRYARRGEIILRQAQDGGVPGIVIIARDEGPGITDVNRAMERRLRLRRIWRRGSCRPQKMSPSFRCSSAVTKSCAPHGV